MAANKGSHPPTPGPAADFDEIADQLYTLPLGDFTAWRTSQEKRLRQSGQKELAARLHGLAKPTVTAWLANQLVRTPSGALRELPELAAELRHATEQRSGDELRRLSRQQRQLVSDLVGQAREVAADAGQVVSEDTVRGLEETFYAALADTRAAEELLAGRLTAPLQWAGFGDWSMAPSTAVFQEAPNASARRRQGGAGLRQGEEEVAEAGAALSTATKALRQAIEEAAAAERAVGETAGEVARLQRELQVATTAASEAEGRRGETVARVHQAEQVLARAQRLQVRAQRRRDALAAAEDAPDG